MRKTSVFLAVLAALSAAACEVSNTLPTVTFGTPQAAGPATGVTFNFNQQPISVTIVNAVRTGTAVATYTVDVAPTPAFDTIVFSRADIAETPGSTTVVLGTLEGGATYYWRSRATVAGVNGEPSSPRSFTIRPNVVIAPPTPVTPASEADVYSARPTFTVANASRTGPAGTLIYEFEVSASPAFATLTATAAVAEQPAQTSWSPLADLPEGTYYWRARARDDGSGVSGGFSDSRRFSRRFGIDWHKVTYVKGPNIANWPETSRVTEAYHTGETLCIGHSLSWPETDFFGDPQTKVEGNRWFFIERNGVWYGGAGSWFRPGQACKHDVNHTYFPDTFQTEAPFNTLVLQPGDVFGVAVSTPARFWPDMKTLDQRSNAVLIVW